MEQQVDERKAGDRDRERGDVVHQVLRARSSIAFDGMPGRRKPG
jgi:hypothetical protein